MAETNLFNINDAGLDDGTIDFYTLIQEPVDVDPDTLRSKIQSLYNEAQANRDHRNLTKRREYQTLLELLPRARMALLEPEKRARYNAYLASARSGTAEVEFDAFMSDLLGLEDTMEEKTGLLGVQDRAAEPRARVIKTPVETPAATTSRSKASASSAPGASSTAIIGGIIGVVLGAVIGHFVFHTIVPTILVAIIVGAVGFVALNRKPATRIRS